MARKNEYLAAPAKYALRAERLQRRDLATFRPRFIAECLMRLALPIATAHAHLPARPSSPVDAAPTPTTRRPRPAILALSVGRTQLPAAMLSRRQQKFVVDKVNRKVDLPFVGENSEGRVIRKFVRKINDDLEPALGAIMPRAYLRCLKIALSERLSVRQRREQVTEIMRGELSAPLADALNERVDASLLPENVEGTVLRLVADEIVEEFCQMIIGEIDEAFLDDGGDDSDSD